MYTSELALLEKADFDLELAGAELLGKDANLICRADAQAQIMSVLSSEDQVDRLVHQITQGPLYDESREVRAISLVARFRDGFVFLQPGSLTGDAT